ncbi:MAG: phosphohistidine phosphatase SixA [Elusimicrobia bacterium]|nr:phosphohistidine phosphatase SixA [Elusimicrobiota bacterium]
MILYLLRHGHSPNKKEAGVSRDEDRPLSSQGQQDIRKIAQALQKETPHLLLSSPLKRAQQTSQQVLQSLKKDLPLRTLEALSGNTAVEKLWTILQREFQDHSKILVVGHQPQLGALASYLMGQASPGLSPGEILALEILDHPPLTSGWGPPSNTLGSSGAPVGTRNSVEGVGGTAGPLAKLLWHKNP